MARPGSPSESVALVPICQTPRPSAKTLRCGAELAELGLTRQEIDLTGLGLVLPEQVPRTILVGHRKIVRADRATRVEGAAGVSASSLCYGAAGSV
jgi:hypothetical protein